MKNVLLLLTAAIALSACTPTPTPEPGPTPNPAPTPTPTPKPLFIPIPGALVGSGDGTKEGTVYVSPTADEIAILNGINEVRTKGTLNGVPVTAGTCVDGTWKALPALTYNGLFAYAARKHADYIQATGEYDHVESQTGAPTFYGANPTDRVARAYREHGVGNVPSVGEVLAGGGITWSRAIDGWMKSPSHCRILMRSDFKEAGAGITEVNTHWIMNVNLR